MTDAEKKRIRAMREANAGYAAIATALGLKKDAVAAFCRRNGLTGVNARGRSPVQSDACPQCGQKLPTASGHKPRRFCSSQCRVTWWNSHPEAVRRKAVYFFQCGCCGKKFTAYGNAHRKYCSHACYIQGRFTQAGNANSREVGFG